MMEKKLEAEFVKFADGCVEFVEDMGGLLQEDVDPIAEAQRSSQIIGSFSKKWTVPIIYLLYNSGRLGFSELGKLLMGISSRTLSLRLKSLEGRGWIHREVADGHPPRVFYSLTERGSTVAKMAGPIYLYIRLTAE